MKSMKNYKPSPHLCTDKLIWTVYHQAQSVKLMDVKNRLGMDRFIGREMTEYS